MKNMFDIIVIGNKRKKILTTDYLKDIEHTVFYSTDYELPLNWVKTSKYTNGSELGAYRCFKAHIDAIELSKHENVLIFEDDAVPNQTDWLKTIKTSLDLLTTFEIVSLHGRNFRQKYFNVFEHNKLRYITPNKKPVWVLGSLAYLIKKETLIKLKELEYDGTPMDILLCNNFKYCCIEKSPFNHDRTFGSILDGNAVI